MLVALTEDFRIIGSTDDGVTWQRLDENISWQRLDAGKNPMPKGIRGIESDLSGGVVVRTNSNFYFERSRSDGSWNPLAATLSPKSDLWFVPGNPERMYAVRGDEFEGPKETDAFLATTDGGRTWTELPKPGGRVPRSLAVAPQNTAVLFADTRSSRKGILRSIDAGKSWEWVDTIVDCSYSCIPTIDPNDLNTLYVDHGVIEMDGGGFTITRTRDGGATWNYFDHRLPFHYKLPFFSLLPTKPTTIIVETRDNSFPNLFSLWRSTDGGTHFNQIGKGLPAELEITAIVADPTRLNILFAATDQGLYRSTDGGITWTLSQHRP